MRAFLTHRVFICFARFSHSKKIIVLKV